MGDLKEGDLIIRRVGNGYVVELVRGMGGLNDIHVATQGDGAVDLTNLIKRLLVTDMLTS